MASSDVDEFLARVAQPQRSTLQTVRECLRAVLPQAEEGIYYAVPAFKVDGVGVAGFAAAKRHCSYYPMSGTVLPRLADRLGGYDWSKGTLRFKIDEPLSEELITALVHVRQQEIATGKH
jgi:uncharacterized protein YdhG (YjbR/CyaY superfamily)